MTNWLTREQVEERRLSFRGLLLLSPNPDAMQEIHVLDTLCDMALAALDARYPRMQMMPDGTLQVLGADYAALQAKADRLAEALERSRDKISDGPFKTHIINQALADYRGK